MIYKVQGLMVSTFILDSYYSYKYNYGLFFNLLKGCSHAS